MVFCCGRKFLVSLVRVFSGQVPVHKRSRGRDCCRLFGGEQGAQDIHLCVAWDVGRFQCGLVIAQLL